MTVPPAKRIPCLPVYEPVRAEDENGQRMYVTPDGYSPSVTTVLSNTRDNSGLQRWREDIGEARADEIVQVACFRGEKLHQYVQDYLSKGAAPRRTMLMAGYWNSIAPFLTTVDQALAMEGAVWHPDGYAGAFDCIAYLADDLEQPTLLDWKTANKPCDKRKLYDYSLQVAAYVNACNYVYKPQGLRIEQAKIVVAIPAHHPQIVTFDARALEQLYQHFLARVQRFTRGR